MIIFEYLLVTRNVFENSVYFEYRKLKRNMYKDV